MNEKCVKLFTTNMRFWTQAHELNYYFLLKINENKFILNKTIEHNDNF